MQRNYIPISRRRVLEEMKKKKKGIKINDCSIGEWLNKMFPDIQRATSKPRTLRRDPMKYGKYGKTSLEQIAKWIIWLQQGDNLEQIEIESGFKKKTIKARIKRALKDKDIIVTGKAVCVMTKTEEK